MEIANKQNAKVFKAFCDENRLTILALLCTGEKCACRLQDALSIGQSTLSHHMKTLCECGLVEVRREGKWSHYSLNCETLAAFQAFIGKLSCDKKNGECECK